MKTRHLLFACVALALSVPAWAQYNTVYDFGAEGTTADPTYSGILSQTPGGSLMSSAPGFIQNQPADLEVLPSGAYEISTSGRLTMLESFPDSYVSSSGLILGSDQRFHGTLASGGKYGDGAVYRLSSTPGSVVYEHDFAGGADGSNPLSPPIQSMQGDFYGTTSGISTPSGAANMGTIYRITKNGVYSVLHVFNGADGEQPVAPLMQSTWGSFYGITSGDTVYGGGTIFRINSDGSFKLLHRFAGTDGASAFGPLIQGNDNNLYGTASGGGANNCGVVFRITPGGTYTRLHSFSQAEGCFPYGGLVQATDGNFYGLLFQWGGASKAGSLFRMTPEGAVTVLYFFPFGGAVENLGTLMQHTNGKLYGQSPIGGANDRGVLFSYNIGAAPFVTYLNVYGEVGAKVTILGQGFVDGSTQVYFNGVESTDVTINPTYIKAVVPAGATTGPITVTTNSTTLTSNKPFIVN